MKQPKQAAPTTDAPSTDAATATTATATTATATTATATEATPAPAAKEKTPEQRATAMRRQAGELRRSAAFLDEASAAGLIARATNLDTDADALAPRKGKASSEPRPQCVGSKRDGTRCTAKAMEGSTLCTDHRPVRARFTDAEWTAWVNLLATSPETIAVEIGWGRAVKLAKAAL